jgi:hypothetical protein
MTENLGLPTPLRLGPFAVVRVGETSLIISMPMVTLPPHHYALLVSEIEFDQIFERICEQRLPYRADPHRDELNHINTWADGRGLYFDDPNGDLLEIITRPYGSGGRSVSKPHPLVASALEPADQESPSD